LLALARAGARYQAVRDRALGGDHLRCDGDPGAARAVGDAAPGPLELVAADLDGQAAQDPAEPTRTGPKRGLAAGFTAVVAPPASAAADADKAGSTTNRRFWSRSAADRVVGCRPCVVGVC